MRNFVRDYIKIKIKYNWNLIVAIIMVLLSTVMFISLISGIGR